MAKVNLTDVVSGYQATTVQNANNTAIETELNDKVLYRDNPDGEPNTMEQELDMNSNHVTNLPTTPTNAAHAASKSYVDSLVSGTTDTGAAQLRVDLASDANGDGASLIGIEDTAGDFTATSVEGALAELVTESVALAGVQTITGDKTVSGNTTLSGTLDANGVNTLAGDTTISGITVLSNTVDVGGVQTNTAIVKWAKGADLGTADITTNELTVGADGNYFDFTGTDTINSIASVGVGTVIKIHFDAAAILTHNTTNLVLPGDINITTVAGDELEFIEYATGDWRLINHLTYLPAEVSGFNRGHIVHRKDDSTFSSVNITSLQAVSATESYGPTGSGADNIWTALDVIPLTASQIILKGWLSGTHNANSHKYLRVRVREVGGSFGIQSEIAGWYGYTPNGSSRSAVGELTVVLNSSNVFEVLWDHDSAWGSVTTINMLFAGWIE